MTKTDQTLANAARDLLDEKSTRLEAAQHDLSFLRDDHHAITMNVEALHRRYHAIIRAFGRYIPHQADKWPTEIPGVVVYKPATIEDVFVPENDASDGTRALLSLARYEVKDIGERISGGCSRLSPVLDKEVWTEQKAERLEKDVENLKYYLECVKEAGGDST